MHTILIPAAVGGTTGSRLVDPKQYTKCGPKRGLKLASNDLQALVIYSKERRFGPTGFTTFSASYPLSTHVHPDVRPGARQLPLPRRRAPTAQLQLGVDRAKFQSH